MAEEIRIKVTPEIAGADKVTALKAKIEELNNLERSYTEKGLPEAAASTRTERIPYARELRDLQRQQRNAERERAASEKQQQRADAEAAKEQKVAEKTELAAGSRSQGRRDFLDQLHVVERRAAGNAKEAAALERSNTIRTRALQLEQQLGFSREKSAQLATREVDAQEKISRSQARTQMMVRGAGALGGAAVGAATVLGEDYFARQALDDRDRAERAINARGVALHGVRGDSASASLSRTRAIADRMFEREQNRAELDSKASGGTFMQTIAGIGAGAMTGGAIGGPHGAVIGAILGGIGGFTRGHLGGKRALMANDREQQRDAELLKQEQAEEQAMRAHETERELKLTHELARGKMSDARASRARLDYFKRYQEIKSKLPDDMDPAERERIAQGGAQDSFDAEMRQREQALGSLIGARTGAGSAARIASLGDRQYGDARSAVQEEIKSLRTDMNANHHSATAAMGLRTFQSPPLKP